MLRMYQKYRKNPVFSLMLKKNSERCWKEEDLFDDLVLITSGFHGFSPDFDKTIDSLCNVDNGTTQHATPAGT